MPWELIDHTGDIGLRVRAPSFELLLAESARGMFEQIADLSGVRLQLEEVVVVEAEEPGELFRAWLAELLYKFSADGRIYVDFDVTLEPGRVRGRVRGERYDPARHPLRTELKAVTYHQLRVAQEKDGWIAQVIFDV